MGFLARCEADGVKLENCTPIFANGWRERRIEVGLERKDIGEQT